MQRPRFLLRALSLAGALTVFLFVAAATPRVAAQQNPANSGPPVFTIGTVAGDPGTTATIPLYFTPGAGKPVRSAHLEVDFISNSVKFIKAEKGPVSSTQDFDLAVDSKEQPDDKNLKHTLLKIDVTAKDPDTKKALPEGLLTFLNFAVPTDAKSFAIELRPVVVSALDAGKAAVKVGAEPGKIIVALPDEPMPGCFFFTH